MSWSDFARFRTGQFISSLCGRCSFISLSWWVLSSTGSKAYFTHLATIFSLACFVTLPLLAPFADRWARRSVAVFADGVLLSGVVFLYLVCANGVYQVGETVLAVVLIAMGTSLMTAVSGPLVTMLVPREEIGSAISTAGALQAIVLLAAPPLAAASSDHLGLPITLQINIGLLLFTLFCTWSIRSSTSAPQVRAKQTWSSSFAEGVIMTTRIRAELHWNLVGAVINGCMVPFSMLVVPVVIVHERHLGLSMAGWVSAATAAGVILGNRIAQPFSARIHVHRSTVISIIMIALGILPFAMPVGIGILAAGAFLAGLGMGMHNVYCSSYRLAATPVVCRSRLSAWGKWFAQAGVPAGLASFGLLLGRTSGSTCACAIATVIVFSAIALARSVSIGELLQGLPGDRKDFYLRRYPLAFGRSI